MLALQRFLRYIRIWTSSDRASGTVPSSMRQFDFAHLLAYELREMGCDSVEVNNYGMVYASLPPTPGYEDCPRIGFIAHLDTFPGFRGNDVKPQVIPDYDGEDVPLGTSGLALRVSEFPHLKQLKGETLITTDGTTLLGADDKAGIAEIMTAVEQVIQDQIPHGSISIAFMPDEEIGVGTKNFDIARFGAQYAYTVDGWERGEIVYENFNASEVTIRIRGQETHTGRAKGRLVNAQLVGFELNSLLPPNDIPSATEGKQGFYHLLTSRGEVSEAVYVYAIRDHDEASFKNRLDTISQLVAQMNEKYGQGTAEFSVKEEYRNMKPMIEPCFHLIEHAAAAAKAVGIEPKIHPSRGGTDGARLSYMGLPCPNMGVGGYSFHGPLEHITAEAIQAVTNQVVEIIRSYAQVGSDIANAMDK